MIQIFPEKESFSINEGRLTCATVSSNSVGSRPLSFWIFFLAVNIPNKIKGISPEKFEKKARRMNKAQKTLSQINKEFLCHETDKCKSKPKFCMQLFS